MAGSTLSTDCKPAAAPAPSALSPAALSPAPSSSTTKPPCKYGECCCTCTPLFAGNVYKNSFDSRGSSTPSCTASGCTTKFGQLKCPSTNSQITASITTKKTTGSCYSHSVCEFLFFFFFLAMQLKSFFPCSNRTAIVLFVSFFFLHFQARLVCVEVIQIAAKK